MKRRKHGINFDLGVPLETGDEFQRLYVDVYPDKSHRLCEWIKKADEGPMFLAGQIGTGKTTFIAKAFHATSAQCDIKISLDTDIPFNIPGAYFGVFLGKVLEYCLHHKINVTSFELSEDFIGIKHEDNGIEELVTLLCGKTVTNTQMNRQRQLFDSLDEKIDFIRSILPDILVRIEAKNKRPPFIFAEGIDKFGVYTSKYFALTELLDFLSRYKTLYEANIVHRFADEEPWVKDSKKLLLFTSSTENASVVLEKRLGVYSRGEKNILPLLVRLSGGNFRQGLRLLQEYRYAFHTLKNERKEAIDYACVRVRDDLLNAPGESIDPGLLKVIHRDKYITTGVVKGFENRDAAQRALYLNWVLIDTEADVDQKWGAALNPLFLPAIESVKDVPDSPETKLVKEWAAANEISPFGLEINTTLGRENILDIINSSQNAYSPLNILEMFDHMAAYFLDPERKDKIIIAYQNEDMVKAANDLIVGLGSARYPGRFKDIDIPPRKRKNQIPLLINRLTADSETVDGYSVFFRRKLVEDELVALERKRDSFLDCKMIWWIAYDHLKEYLKYWPQLRQFFKIYRLEEDILANISKEDIEEDLQDLEYTDFIEAGPQYKRITKKRLKNILAYLESRK